MSLLVLTYKLLVLSWITAKRQLIHNRTAQRNQWNQNYDFIIVGAGGAGCVVANRLTENPNINVLLLEAGGPQDALYTDIPNLYFQISQKRPNLLWPYYLEPELNLGPQALKIRSPSSYAKLIGGSASHSGMTYLRGNHRDYDNWEQTFGAKGWAFKSLLPYFKRFENNTDRKIVKNNPAYHSTKGPVQISTPRNPHKIYSVIVKSLNKLGFDTIDLNADNQTGTMILQSYIDQNGFRSGSANPYIDPNPHPNNLHIVSKALVMKIVFDGVTAIGVEFARNDTSYRVYARKEVIVTSGPFQSPQLLMLSGIGPANHLREFNIPVLLDLPVGNSLITHANAFLIAGVDPNLINPSPELSITQLSELYFKKSGPLSEVASVGLPLSTTNNLDKEWPNFLIEWYVFGQQLSPNSFLTRPRSLGTVRLQSDSPYVYPKISANIFSDSRDYKDMVDGLKFTMFIMETTAVANYTKLPTFESLGCPSCNTRYMYECDQGIRCAINSSVVVSHPVGNCRMGAVQRADVVVDPQLRVKNAKHLRVCDSSVFPQIPNANILAATLVVAEKCSQMIKDYYKIN